jgi:hypothetical protein
MIWCEVDEFAGGALKCVVVIRGAGVYCCPPKYHCAPAVEAYWILWHDMREFFECQLSSNEAWRMVIGECSPIRLHTRVSRGIEKIVDGIGMVSIQTSMLAVNGSVEAARDFCGSPVAVHLELPIIIWSEDDKSFGVKKCKEG